MYGAFVAAVSYRWVAQRETVNPSVAFTQELSHILIHPAAPYGSVLLETSSSNCKSGWSHNRILCELWVCLNCYCCSLLSIRKRICFKVQVLITDMGLLPIKVREWILLQLCSHFSFSDWTEKKIRQRSVPSGLQNNSAFPPLAPVLFHRDGPIHLLRANFNRPSDQSLPAVSVAVRRRALVSFPSKKAFSVVLCSSFNEEKCLLCYASFTLTSLMMIRWLIGPNAGQKCSSWSLSLIQLPCKVTI